MDYVWAGLHTIAATAKSHPSETRGGEAWKTRLTQYPGVIMKFRESFGVRLLCAASLVVATLPVGSIARADEAKTFGESFNVPVFESVDSNGVNLITGQLQVLSPTITTGSEQARVTVGLRWTGRAWTMIGVPQIWRKDGVYTVVYNGVAEEFNGRGSNYSQRKPITGSKLGCSIFEPGNLASQCLYTNRNGDVIIFRGMETPETWYPDGYGQSAYMYGNLGISMAELFSVDNGFIAFGSGFPTNGYFVGNDPYAAPHYRRWGNNVLNALADASYNKRDYKIQAAGQTLTVTTPNHDGTDDDEHFLLPKNTTQTITDDLGAVWAYTVNNDREMTLIDPPGNAANISITYDANHKVKTITNADGTWTYNYPNDGDFYAQFRTTTVTNPLGEVAWIKYNREKEYVTEARDPNNRTTYYQYDSGDRLSKVTYPEGNSVSYTYDARGNITSETRTPKVGQGTPFIRSAGYPATCSDAVLCNLPTYTVDANGNRTDFEYAPTTSRTVYYPKGGTTAIAEGTTKPTRILLPAVSGVRPETRNAYQDGMLIRSAECRTSANCAGTSDEVVTEYDYGGTTQTRRVVFGKAVTADGATLRSCFAYDGRGRMISETPAKADVGSCPAAQHGTLSPTAITPAAANPVSVPTYPTGN